MEAGIGLESCTTKVAYTKPFMIANDRVVLIDTPGFDNNVYKDLGDVLNDVKAQKPYCISSDYSYRRASMTIETKVRFVLY
jgi:hypothetical protein